jgi:hypothetical protein
VFDGIEAFCTAYDHTIHALGVIGTLLAVIISLVLVYRASIREKTRLVAKLSISTILHPTISPHPRFVVLSIKNTGNLPLQVLIGFFSWRVPFSGRQKVILPIDSTGIAGVVPQKTYPFEIKPRTSEAFYISEASEFVKQMNDFRKEQNCTGRFLFFLKRAVVSSADGQTFRAKGDRWITAAAGPPGVGLFS